MPASSPSPATAADFPELTPPAAAPPPSEAWAQIWRAKVVDSALMGNASALREALAEAAELGVGIPAQFPVTGTHPAFAAAMHGGSECLRVLAPFFDLGSLAISDSGHRYQPVFSRINSSPDDNIFITVQTSQLRGATLLIAAVRCGSCPDVGALLEFCDPNAVDALGFTAFQLAARNGDLKSLEALAPHVDAAQKTQHHGRLTPLMLAALNSAADCVEFLLPLNDANAQDDDGKTALMHALSNQKNTQRVMDLLLVASDLSIVDGQGESALIHAFQRLSFFGSANSGSRVAVDFIAGFPPDEIRRQVNAFDAHGQMPLTRFLSQFDEGHRAPLAQPWLEWVDSSAKNRRNQNILDLAMAAHNWELAESLAFSLGEREAQRAWSFDWAALRDGAGKSREERLPRLAARVLSIQMRESMAQAENTHLDCGAAADAPGRRGPRAL